MTSATQKNIKSTSNKGFCHIQNDEAITKWNIFDMLLGHMAKYFPSTAAEKASIKCTTKHHQ